MQQGDKQISHFLAANILLLGGKIAWDIKGRYR